MKNFMFRKSIWWVTLFFITLSGFAQMPIFKRYYIADIPGLGWLAKFYITHIIHYLAAIVLIALVCYAITDFFLQKRSGLKITGSGKLKSILVGGLLITGGMMAYKNLPGVFMDHILVSMLDLIHLGLCMVLLGAGFYSVIRKKGWLAGH